MAGGQLTRRLRLDWFWLREALRRALPWVSRRAHNLVVEEADYNARQVLALTARLEREAREAELARAFAKDAYAQMRAARRALEAAQAGSAN